MRTAADMRRFTEQAEWNQAPPGSLQREVHTFLADMDGGRWSDWGWVVVTLIFVIGVIVGAVIW